MKLTRNMKAISKLLLILLLLTVLIIGAILSYLWVVGYYITLGIRVPEETTISITGVTFNSQDTSYFNVTLLNPSYSPTDANITQIAASPKDGFLYNVPPNETHPQLPYKLPKAKEKTFKCIWNWANYTGKTVKIIVSIADGSGWTFEAETPLVDLRITDVGFDPAISVTRFNLTIRNYDVSVTYLNVTRITVNMEKQTVREWTVENGTEVDPHLPYTLSKNSSETFVCPWNWAEHGDKNVTITVYTLQGFTAQYSQVTPAPIILEITDVAFDPLNTTRFNVTVKNSEFSTMNANITEITVTVDGISGNITDVVPSLQAGITLSPEANQTLTCFWNWSVYSGKNATIVVQTQEGYSASHLVLLKALTIIDVIFNLLDTDHFVASIQNPTLLDFTIATMNVTVEGTASLNVTAYVVPSIPFMLPNDTNILFMCSWNWSGHNGKNVTVTIETLEGYTTSYTRTIPSE